ncbi:MAG TPA: hypothetical protein VGE79_03800 [Niastella sp.]
MKKAKILLTAIAVFAVVGGAMAFKARVGHTIYTTAIAGQPGAPVAATTTTTGAVKVYVTDLPNTPATFLTFTIAQP